MFVRKLLIFSPTWKKKNFPRTAKWFLLRSTAGQVFLFTISFPLCMIHQMKSIIAVEVSPLKDRKKEQIFLAVLSAAGYTILISFHGKTNGQVIY